MSAGLPAAAGAALPRHGFILGIRGLLAAMVVVIHVHVFCTFGQPGLPWYWQTNLWLFPLTSSLVGAFVVMSGYSLMLTVVGGSRPRLPGGFGGYLRRRAVRILPAYYTSMVVSLLCLHAVPPAVAGSQTVSAGDLLAHIFLVHDLNEAWHYGINPPYWNLAAEEQLYILFGLVLVPLFLRWGTAALLGVGAAGALLLSLSPTLRLTHPWFLLLFCGGMAGAALTERRSPRHDIFLRRVRWDLVALGLALACLVDWLVLLAASPAVVLRLPVDLRPYALNESLIGLACLAAILFWAGRALGQPPLPPHGSERVLCNPWLRWAGSFAYSTYLIHFPVIWTTWPLLARLGLGTGGTLVLGCAIYLPLCHLAGFGLFMAVERHCTRVRAPFPWAGRRWCARPKLRLHGSLRR